LKPNRDYVLKALLQKNFLPNQRSRTPELPPLFESVTFTPEVAADLARQQMRTSKALEGYHGYESVDFFSTKFDGISRRLSIPHPLSQAHLCLCIHENWNQLRYTSLNSNSKIRPKHHSDGRLVVMNYGHWKLKQRALASMSMGKHFVVSADIAQCFPSIYTHSIAWAAVGLKEAKSDRQ